MLPLLQKKRPRTTLFFLQVCGVVLLGHIILLMVASIAMRAHALQDIYVQSSYLSRHANLVVMPYMRSVGKKTLRKQSRSVVAKKSRPQAAPAKPKVVAQKKMITKRVVPKKSPAKKVALKPETKPVQKSVSPESTKKEPTKKQEAKKVEPQKSVQAVQPAAKEVAAAEPLYIGRNDLEAMELHDAVAGSIHAQWHPPLGIEPARPCTLHITVASNGAVDAVTIAEGSGVLAYDMAARMAVSQAEFPKVAHGQSFSVHL